MGSGLQHLGRFAFKHRRLVLAFWVLVLAALAVLFVGLHKPYNSQFTVPGTSSQKATDTLAKVNPTAKGGSGTAVIAAPAHHSVTEASARAQLERSLTAARNGPGIASISDPYTAGGVSRNGQIAKVTVTFKLPDDAVTSSQRSALSKAFATVRTAGLRAYFGGAAAPPTQQSGATEGIGIVIALAVLTITFGSLLSAGMPLLSAALGVGLGLLGIGVVNAFTQLTSTTSTLATMLGLAVGIDYALFIITRYRATVRELSVGPSGPVVDLPAAIGLTVATAGSAVVFAGTTIVIALCALSVCGIPFLTAMGLAGAATIAVAVLIALTLVPALLGFAGSRAFKGKMIDASPAAAKPTWGRHWGAFVTRHRGPAAIAVIVILGALAIPVLGMRQGLPTDGGAPTSTTQRHAYDLITRGFGEGSNGPLLIVAAVPQQGAKHAASVVESKLKGLKDVVSVSPPTLQPGGRIATITVIPRSGPSSSATTDLVHTIRGDASAIRAVSRADISVAGETATNADVVAQVSNALVPYLLVVIGLALVLLIIAFRSILVPLTALLGFLLTIGASLGTLVLVFQHGLAKNIIGIPRPEPILSFLPILAIGVLFGLAMDYEVFLVSRMREERGKVTSAQDAVHNGFGYGARVVTAAALIMVGVFASFVITDDPTTKSIGFALATGILFDAFFVRLTLIPALMSMLGDRAWHLPRWLDKILPHVDLEGASLKPGPRPSELVGKGRLPTPDAVTR